MNQMGTFLRRWWLCMLIASWVVFAFVWWVVD